MKELSVEEKAKRYDEAIKIAGKIHNEHKAQPFDVMLKVFPELKESEDESIRKEIIAVFKGQIPFTSEENGKKYIAWLEKQGEKESVTCPICGWEIEKQGEQKPAWSEEDENVLEDIEEAIINYWHGDTQDILLDWIKSLKNKVIPQPKQEWSEEDKRKIGDIRDAITLDDELEESYKEELYDFLKSLKDRYTWKSSDEQMITLRHVISGCSYDIEPLVELETKLKEL